MKRELKPLGSVKTAVESLAIAEPIPMKRELKPDPNAVAR